MRNLFKTALLGAFIVLTGIGCTRVGVGEVGIEVSMAGSNRGAQDIPVRTGWVFYNPIGTSIIEYPTYVQTAVWTHDKQEGSPNNEEISFNSKDGLVFYADVNLSYHLESSKIAQFYVKYKASDINTFTHGMMRQVARDEFNNVAATMLAEDIYGPKKEEFVRAVLDRVNKHFSDVGLIIESLGFIGAPRPPQQFVDAINAKLSATQNAIKAENELREAKANAAKQIAYAEGEARANQIKAASLTPGVIEWRKLEIQEKALYRWQGHVPQYVGGNSPTPFFDVTASKK